MATKTKRKKKSKKVTLDKLLQRDKYLQRKYGITLEQYNLKLTAQNDSCELCKKHKSLFSKSLAVDHNHKSNVIRGLLCYRCNKFLVGRNNLESATKLYNYMVKYEST